MATGLTTMTGMTGGASLCGSRANHRSVRSDQGRIANDYELAIETVPTDADGKLRDVSVKVDRPDVSVRTHRQVLLDKSDAAGSNDPLLALLAQPVDIADLPIAVASSPTRAEEPASLRVLLSPNSGRRLPTRRLPSSIATKSSPTTPALHDEVGERLLTTSLQLAPGRYRIRVAAAASDGRAGSSTPL